MGFLFLEEENGEGVLLYTIGVIEPVMILFIISSLNTFER